MPDLNRRTFVGALLSLPVLGLSFPRALIGDPAGGYYQLVPDDLTNYIEWYDWVQPSAQSVEVKRCIAYGAWSPLGGGALSLQLFGGTIVRTPLERQTAQVNLDQMKEENLLRSMRQCMDEHHKPGWFKVTETVTTDEPQGYDEDGQPYFYKMVSRWRRVSYVRWMKPTEVRTHGREISLA